MNAPAPVELAIDGDQYSVWRDQLCDAILRVDTPKKIDGGFAARIRMMPIGEPVVFDIGSVFHGLEITRNKARIARESTETFGLSLVLSGQASVTAGSAETVLQTGDVCLLRSSEPFAKICSADYREQFILMPSNVIESAIGASKIANGHALVPRHGLGALVSEWLISLSRAPERLSPGEWGVALDGVLRMIGATVVPPELIRTSVRDAQRDRALRYIETHLDDPRLTPQTIAAALRISPRYLHGLFEGTGQSVGARILAKRLDKSRAMLLDPRHTHLNVSEIAFRCGFNEAAHFSRTFKTRFGARPTEIRRS